MSNLLKTNAYHVLGIDTSTSQKDIQKKVKEIIKILQIDEVPEYNLDLDIFDDFRTETLVKEALQKLTSPKKHIKDYFFWFYINDEIDQEALDVFCQKKPLDAIKVWDSHAKDDSTKSLFYKKNLAILYCLLLFKESNKKYLKESINLWHEIYNSAKFWSAFKKIYKLNDELNVDQDILSEFQKHCSSYLSDLYTELSHAHKDDSYISEFTKAFKIRGEKTAKAVLAPIFDEITDAAEKLEAMNISEDGEMDKEETAQIKKYISKIEECSNKLIDLGLYDDSQAKTIMDRAAAAIRVIVLDIHNNLDDIPKAEQLLRIAMEFAGTTGMKHKLQQDLDTFENNKKDMAKLGPVMNLIKDKKFVEAIALIDKTKEENKHQEDLVAAMNVKKKEAVTMYATIEFLEARKLFEADQYDRAAPMLQKAASIVYESIEIFDVNKEVVDSWLETIKGNVKIMTADNAKAVDEVQNDMIKKIDDAFDERWEQMAMKVLINGYYFVGLCEVIKNKKSSNFLSTIIGWAVMFGILWLIGVISQ